MAEDKKSDAQALRERMSKHLRTADEYSRAGRYNEAIEEIQRALEIDPKNNYARSFLERVRMLQKRNQQKEAEQLISDGISYDEKSALISQHLSVAELYINKRDFKRALEEIAAVYKIDPKNYYAQTYSERIETLMLEQDAKTAAIMKEEIKEPVVPISTDSVPEIKVPLPISTQPARVEQPVALPERGSLMMYRELLKDYWFNGKITNEEATELSNMRALFGITMEEHNNLEREVKIDAYVEALTIAWRDNVLSNMEQHTVQMMRDKYNISAEEQKIAEARYNEMKNKAKNRIVVLIVDPNRDNLVNLNKLMKQRGYNVFITQKVEDALPIINTQPLSFIISEIIFPKGQMDGIALLKKVREKVPQKFIPFFLMSSVIDEKVIHASYRLGADYFLKKPVNTDELLSILQGKQSTIA